MDLGPSCFKQPPSEMPRWLALDSAYLRPEALQAAQKLWQPGATLCLQRLLHRRILSQQCPPPLLKCTIGVLSSEPSALVSNFSTIVSTTWKKKIHLIALAKSGTPEGIASILAMFTHPRGWRDTQWWRMLSAVPGDTSSVSSISIRSLTTN